MPPRRAMRLTDSPEFEKVYREGMAYRGKLFSMHVFPNEAATARLGLSVSKKVGNAVTRNAVRRRLREVFYGRVPLFRRNVDVVISARPAAATAEYADLEREFARALRKTGACGEERDRR